MTLVIRPAAVEDIEFLSWTILASQRGHLSRGWFDIALDRPEPECLAFVRRLTTARTQSWWHSAHFWIAETEGVAGAALCVQPAAGAASAARSALEEATSAHGFDAAEQAAIWRRGAYAGECWMPGDAAAWLIEHVATHPSHRRRGLVLALLRHACVVGRQQGCRKAQLTFVIGNEAAQAAYAKAGFQFAEEKRSPRFEAVTGAPGFRRYERQI
jgi:ribosomal protein S18 acetylase RimI-like enzyme